jgi:hypothetical protein
MICHTTSTEMTCLQIRADSSFIFTCRYKIGWFYINKVPFATCLLYRLQSACDICFVVTVFNSFTNSRQTISAFFLFTIF